MEAKTRPRPLAGAVIRAQPDDRLVALAREGRDAAFEEIVRRYRAGLVPFAAAFAPRDRAEDVVQESLVRAWESLRNSESEIRLKPWLYTIVRNRALNARRDARIHEQLDESIDGVRQPSEIVLTREELGRMVGAVNALPEPQRKALVRSALEGRTHEQLAAELGTSAGAVRQLIFRARSGLREAVGAALPLPVVRALAETNGAADAGAAVVGGGALAAGSLGAAGTGSIAGKATAVAAIAALVGGSGVAIERASEPDEAAQRSSALLSRGADGPVGGGSGGDGRGTAADASPDRGSPSGGGSQGGGADEEGEDESAERGDDDSRDGSGSEDDGESGDSSGSGSGDDVDEDDFGPDAAEVDDTSGSSGSGGTSGSGGSDLDGSGSGTGSDSGSFESSGPGSGGELELDDSGGDSSGSGSGDAEAGEWGSSGSGSSGSDGDPLAAPAPDDE